MKKQNKPVYTATEVMQHWIDEKGQRQTLSIQTQSMTMYYDSWKKNTALEIRTKSNKEILRQRISPESIYPKKKILPIIKRNGFRGGFYGFSPHELFSLILSNPIAEILLKNNQISLLKESNNKNIQFYFQPIKICIRNQYTVKDASLWFDYIDLLNHFNKDISNRHYVCPENLKKEHDRYEKKKREQDKAKRLNQLKQEAEMQEAQYREEKSIFFDLHFKSEKVDIIPLKSVQEFIQEGETLQHCVFTNEYHKKNESLILSARQNGKPIETIEVSLEEYSIKQSRGLFNKSSRYHNHIVTLVGQNMYQIANLQGIRQTG